MLKENKTVKKTSNNKITKQNKIKIIENKNTNKTNKTVKNQKVNLDKIKINPDTKFVSDTKFDSDTDSDTETNSTELEQKLSSINTSDMEQYSNTNNQEKFNELDNMDFEFDDDSNYQELNDSDIYEKDDNYEPNSNIQTNTQTHNIDLDDVYKIFEKIFSAQAHSYFQNDYTDDSILHIRKESVMEIFEAQIKKQLIDITENGHRRKMEEQANSQAQDDTYKKMEEILLSIEQDPDFIGLSDDELIKELKNIPTQNDFDDFCKQVEYEKKLTFGNSTKREKLFTIMYTIGNYCVGPDIKNVLLRIIKFEVIRNELIDKIRQVNLEYGRCDMLDCITSDMLFIGLGHFISHTDMKIISRNLAYYFTKIS
jgi:hypothetical protein